MITEIQHPVRFRQIIKIKPHSCVCSSQFPVKTHITIFTALLPFSVRFRQPNIPVKPEINCIQFSSFCRYWLYTLFLWSLYIKNLSPRGTEPSKESSVFSFFLVYWSLTFSFPILLILGYFLQSILYNLFLWEAFCVTAACRVPHDTHVYFVAYYFATW